MSRSRLLFVLGALVVAGVGVGVGAEDLTDFSNDLATDVGPLLALFGESMTKQYLSESTAFLDYFIFAMAPIGIITAIVSAIRVCGHSTLRAFVGRSQEGDGGVEAELCTSTSRDVCELFNKGGITRVLGQSQILELIYFPPQKGAKAHLFIFRHFLSQVQPPESPDWVRIQGGPPFAPRPNLSLNVGIKKQPKWVFWLVAIVGLILQSGVVAFSGVAAWLLGWDLDKSGTPAQRDYAPIMFMIGTVLMCVGMWSCAALIGQTTYETRYRRQQRKNGDKRRESRLLWLQPGPQSVGDQSFDPFAYFDKQDDPLQEWTSSRKDFDDRKFETLTFFAVITTLLGYIMQFIGLRGLNAWVSISQLIITLVMSVLRGLLRIQRLGRNDNKLAKMPDLVAGHELDWLAFEIAHRNSQKISWHVTGKCEEVKKRDRFSLDKARVPLLHVENDGQSRQGENKASSESQASQPKGSKAWKNDIVEIFQIRQRLACLTGCDTFEPLEENEYQVWDDQYVKVRSTARKLSAAICQACQSLLQRNDMGEVILVVKAMAFSVPWEKATYAQNSVGVTLRPPTERIQTRWSTDTAQIEAILGLWVWSLFSNEQLHMYDESGNRKSLVEKIEAERIVSAGLDDSTWHRKGDRRAEMDLWLGPNKVRLSEALVTVDKTGNYSLEDRWVCRDDYKPDMEDLPKWTPPRETPGTTTGRARRFCGWNAVPEVLASDRPLRIQYAAASDSILEVCTQELFLALMMSLRTRLPENDVVVVENAGMIRLESPTVTALARAFIDNGLGSYADAILCIVPALGDNFRPDKKQMLSVVIKGADNYRKEGEWKRAETLMRWACQCYSSAPKEEQVKEPEATAIFTEALLATGELYRWSLAQLSESGRRFGLKGIAWMQKVYGHHHHPFLFDPPSSTDDKRPPDEEWGHTYAQATELKEIIERYRDIASKFCKFDQTTKDTPQIQQLFIESLQSRNRTDALYYLCFIAVGQFGSSTLSSALPLAVRNDWKEVVDSVLELGADPNSQDSIGRTAISYCAELGYEEYFDQLLELSASPDLPDQNQQSPLFWAAEAGQERLLELLLAHPQVDPSRRDNKLRTPLTGAMLRGHERAFQMLLDAGRGRIDINAPDSFNITPLYWAVESGSKAFARMLLKEDCILPSAPNRDTRDSALSSAVRRQEADIVQLMLDAGAKVDYEATYGAGGQTALIVAADVGNEAIFKMLLETNRFDVNKRDRWGDDALTTAKRAKSGGIVQMLTERPDIRMEK